MLPPISTGNPAQRKICPTRAVVVDFPLVPVIPIMRGSIKFLTKISISPIIGVFAFFAFLATTCGLGYECGMPGLRINASILVKSSFVKSLIFMPSNAVSLHFLTSSSPKLTVWVHLVVEHHHHQKQMNSCDC